MANVAFPGEDVTTNNTEIVDRILRARNPQSLSLIDAFNLWTPTGKEALCALITQSDEFYVLYEHPVFAQKNKLYLCDRTELLTFINREIKPERMEGLDITVASSDFRQIIVCNHDGEIFLVN